MVSNRGRVQYDTSGNVDPVFALRLSCHRAWDGFGMNRLEAAEARFSTALEALESSVDEALAAARAATNARTEIALLRAERERLIARIAALEEETRMLAGLTGEAEERLDGAIAEIREALARH